MLNFRQHKVFWEKAKRIFARYLDHKLGVFGLTTELKDWYFECFQNVILVSQLTELYKELDEEYQ